MLRNPDASGLIRPVRLNDLSHGATQISFAGAYENEERCDVANHFGLMLELVLALALVLLFSAWFVSFFDRRVRLGLVPLWRRVVSWGTLLLLTASLIEALYCFEFWGRGGRSFGVILLLAETGLVLAAAAFLTCWFASRKTLACLLPSTLLIAGAWFLMLSRLA